MTFDSFNRQTLGDSLRNVAQEPIDPVLLENETRR